MKIRFVNNVDLLGSPVEEKNQCGSNSKPTSPIVALTENPNQVLPSPLCQLTCISPIPGLSLELRPPPQHLHLHQNHGVALHGSLNVSSSVLLAPISFSISVSISCFYEKVSFLEASGGRGGTYSAVLRG